MTSATINAPIAVGYDNGDLIVGHDADTPVRWRLSDGGRLRSGVILGRACTGKTTLLAGIATAAISAGMQVWSSQLSAHHPALAVGITHRAFGIEGARDILRDAILLMEERDAHDVREEIALRPWPGVLIILDDAGQALADDEIRRMVCSIPINGSWAGLGVIAATGLYDACGGLMERQYALLGGSMDHWWAMPNGQTSPGAFDGHLIEADDYIPTTATPFTFNWQS